MHIAHTESSHGWGGQEIRILSEAVGMRDRGHAMTIVAPRGHRIFGEARARGLEVVDLPIARKSINSLIKMRQWLARARPDVVNTHSSIDSWLVALACKTLARAPAIVRTRHVSVPVANNASTRWLYSAAAHRVVTTGEMLREQLIRENGLDASHVVSVPTGILADRFVAGDKAKARRATGLPPTGLLIGIVATLRSWKGHRFLLEAFSRLQGNVNLVIVGDGPQRAALEQQSRELGIDRHVHFAGDRADVVPWLQAMDVFVLPSYAHEGVPQALVQAMMTGLACLTTSIGAIPEVARDGDTALVVPPRDVDALARSLQRLIDDPALRATLGASGRAHCVAHLGFETMVDKMEAVFARAVATTGTR